MGQGGKIDFVKGLFRQYVCTSVRVRFVRDIEQTGMSSKKAAFLSCLFTDSLLQ